MAKNIHKDWFNLADVVRTAWGGWFTLSVQFSSFLLAIMEPRFNRGIFSVSDTGILTKENPSFPNMNLNLWPPDYYFGCSTTELQETRGN